MFRSTKQRFGTAFLTLAALAAACGGDEALPSPDRSSSGGDFDVWVVDHAADAPAGAEAADIDGDGDLDLVVNFFGDRGPDPGPIDFPPGGITIYLNDGALDRWTKVPVLTRDDGQYFPNEAHPVDLDGDGDLDLLVAGGFFVCEFNPEIGPCGALFWLEQIEPDSDGSLRWERHDIVATGAVEFYHRVEVVDLDGDGLDDLVTVGETIDDAHGHWFRGADTITRFDPTPVVLAQGGGSIPITHDVDGDGDLDLASGEFFFEGASFAWLENQGDTWQRHMISDELGRSIQLSVVPDLLGEGRDGWVGSNHVNTVTGDPEPASGIYLLTPPDDPREPWSHRMISTAIESRPTVGLAFQAAPGVFSWGDVDGDGDIDLTVSGDGDHRVFWLEQTEPGEFRQHTLLEDFGQAAGGTVADLDGDGTIEVVFTSYDTGEVLIFRLRR